MKESDADKILGEAILKGDVTAFRTFFKMYHQRLLGFVITLTQDKDLAEDITQMAFITVWKRRKNLQKATGLKQYLYKTAKNLFIDHYRSTKSRADLYAELTTEAFIDYRDEDEEYVQEQIKKLRRIIEALPARCQEILRLTKLEGLKQQEVADYLGISIRTVESQIRIAYQSIREEFDKDDPLILFFLIGAFKQMEKEEDPKFKDPESIL